MSKRGGGGRAAFGLPAAVFVGRKLERAPRGFSRTWEVTLVVLSVGHGSREWLWIHIQQFHMTRQLSRSC